MRCSGTPGGALGVARRTRGLVRCGWFFVGGPAQGGDERFLDIFSVNHVAWGVREASKGSRQRGEGSLAADSGWIRSLAGFPVGVSGWE